MRRNESMPMSSTRRTLLASAAALVTNAVVTAPAARAMPGVGDWPLWSALPSTPTLVALGRHCATRLPELAALSSGRLSGALAARLGTAPSGAASRVARALNQRIARDFAHRDIIEVDGWYLSLTEVLLALTAFDASADSSAP
jgi:hypothetical protein